jgi:hypothetical protein
MTAARIRAEHLDTPAPSLTRELGERVAYALIEENLGTPAERAAAIADRATQAVAIATHQEHDRQDTFAQLNPEFGVLPDSRDPDQHRFAQQRERALALGQRVTAAEQSAPERREPPATVHMPRRSAERQGAER